MRSEPTVITSPAYTLAQNRIEADRIAVAQAAEARERAGAFDYSALDNEIATEARQVADRLRNRIRTFTYETGKDLIAMKEKMPHGAFGPWIEAEFQMGERTAQNYMNAARLVEGKSEKIALLPPSAVYALAAPSTPPEVVQEVLSEIERGAVPKVADIRERIAGVTKARKAAENAKTAEQIKREKENEKRRRAADAARERKFREEQELNETQRNDRAKKAATFLVAQLRAEGALKLIELMRGTDWHRVERHFTRGGYMGSELPIAEIEAAFPAAAQ